MNDFAGADAAYQKAISISDTSPLAYLNLGTLYKLHVPDFPKAEQYYLTALSKDSVPFFSDYESVADLYVNYYKTKNVDIEALMLQGADKISGVDNLYNYFLTKDAVKAAEYKAKVLKLVPNYSFTNS